MIKDFEKDNPNANWKNLITGIVILLLVGIFSVWYFSSNDQDDLFEGLDAEVQEKTNTTPPLEELGDVQGDTSEINEEGMVEVKAGEGLWQVAKRVCGDGEKYNYLAEANGLNIWRARLAPGQMLKVNCGNAN